MSRTLSMNLRSALHAQEMGIVPIVLVKIEHEDLGPNPFLFSSDPTEMLQDDPLMYGTRSGGKIWYFVPFSFVMPDERADTAPTQRLIIENIDRTMVELLRSTTTPAKVTCYIVMSNDPDVVEIEGVAFDLSSAAYDAQQIEMTLTVDSLVTEPYPWGTFNPAQFPGLF